MADGPACTGVAHGPHGPSMPDCPGSTSLSGDNDARGGGPSVASVPAGFALFGSASDASQRSVSGSPVPVGWAPPTGPPGVVGGVHPTKSGRQPWARELAP